MTRGKHGAITERRRDAALESKLAEAKADAARWREEAEGYRRQADNLSAAKERIRQLEHDIEAGTSPALRDAEHRITDLTEALETLIQEDNEVSERLQRAVLWMIPMLGGGKEGLDKTLQIVTGNPDSHVIADAGLVEKVNAGEIPLAAALAMARNRKANVRL